MERSGEPTADNAGGPVMGSAERRGVLGETCAVPENPLGVRRGHHHRHAPAAAGLPRRGALRQVRPLATSLSRSLRSSSIHILNSCGQFETVSH